jgi:hypothetical protein
MVLLDLVRAHPFYRLVFSMVKSDATGKGRFFFVAVTVLRGDKREKAARLDGAASLQTYDCQYYL